ncbi:hypothetical protein [Nonomuraea basaltis]|uniref:hypothetical protein n=1 Tax=Nonomuraea basaltis TaxID=2495887 RepID=UPI00110C4525|nr:hypothetical protein [Nonomuraea basaltis]TMR91977.1 hypothetical protein EJK15_47000 [Nonomuraea basaltis]
MARVLATVTVLAAPLAVTASPVSATTANRTVSAEAALACATPCTWLSGPHEARIRALKAAETQAKMLAEQNYMIELVTTITTQTAVGQMHKGKVRYVRR